MTTYWTAVGVVCLAALASTVGTVLIRVATDQSNLTFVVLGSSFWSMSAAGFVFASDKGIDLGAAAAMMSAVALLTINVLGLVWFGDTYNHKRLLGLLLIVFAMVLLVAPPSSN